MKCVFYSLTLPVAREHIVGWYHTGPKLHPNDIAIHELIAKFCANPVSPTFQLEPIFRLF